MKVSIGTRLLVGFALLLALAVAQGVYAIYTLGEIRDIQATVSARDLKVLDLFRDLAEQQSFLKGYRERAVAQALLRKENLTEQDPRAPQERWRQGAQETAKYLSDLEAWAAEYEQAATGQRRKELWAKIRQNAREATASWKDVGREAESLFEAINRADWKGVAARIDAANRVRETFDEKLGAGAQLTADQIQVGGEVATASYETARTSLVVGLAVLLLAGGGFAAYIHRSITTPLGAFQGLVGRVGQGDLTQQAPASPVTDLDRLGEGLNGMVAGLKAVASQTIGVTQSLNTATAEIMASIQEQAASTREQAATVQEITTTMEEVHQTGGQISARAKQVAAAAEATSTASQSGTQAVQETNRIMGLIREQVEEVAENIVALSEKTQAVGEIIATVNDIAERSNLLALNAAIEAAAAGEQGNRFSVVAGEMKNLADQAKDSTVQVRTILGDIQKGINSSVMLTEEAVKRVEGGKQQADVAEQTIRQLGRTMLENIQAFEQIIGAGNQQQIGFEQVAQGMKDIRQAAGQTASATSQLEKAVVSLSTLSLELKEAVGRYKL